LKYKIVLAAVGSLGDLHPFVALGLALRAQGLGVVVASAAEYRDKVERAGLEFRPVRPSFADVERDLALDRAALTRAARSEARPAYRRNEGSSRIATAPQDPPGSRAEGRT